ncbi:MAG TPA: ferric reductase-like transmembrane domain-containing protein [Candidatus Nanopelagicales bacterium]|nr:ferric reductase-like transmembrane domain-containing protein [Candidatus Nanopelagicales bacterium]
MLDGLRPAALPLPRRWSLRSSDLGAVAGGIALLIVLMWARHGGAAELGSPAGISTAAGQLAALLGTYAALLQLVLVSRSPFLDQVVGPDRLAWVHRWLGFATAWLIGGHVLLTTVGYALGGGRDVVDQVITFLGTYPFMPAAAAGFALFVLVTISSVRAARRRLSYETWFGLHLFAYLGIALAFAHQIAVGADFVDDPVAVAFWVGLYAATAALLLAFRVGQPVALAVRHRFRVASVVVEAPGVVSIYVTGRDLDRLAVRAGQFFLVRLLTADGWWRAHPFSLSAAPNGRFLRFTVKDLGDWSGGRLQRLPVGTRLILEGPYGILTGARRTRPKVLLVAGGVGITPLRALLEALPGRPGDLALVYRAPRPEEVVFRGELDAIARARGATLHYLVGRRGDLEIGRDPLGPDRLAALVPDVRDRDVYLCGPLSLMDAAERSLRRLGVPASQIHLERFST